LISGGSADALKALTAVAQDYPPTRRPVYLIGWVLNRESRGVEAERSLREHLRRSPASPKGLAQLAVAMLAQARYAMPLDLLEQAIQLKADLGRAAFQSRLCVRHLGRDEDAIRQFRETLRLDPNYLDAYITLADLLNLQGQRDEPSRAAAPSAHLNPADERASVSDPKSRRDALNLSVQ